MFKKFEFSYYSSLGPAYKLSLKNGKWFYETENDFYPTDLLVDMRPVLSAVNNNEIISYINSYPAEIEPSQQRLKRLHRYLKQYCKHWKKDYSIKDIDDGYMWSCNIEGTDFKLKSEGHLDRPGNFGRFLFKLTIFTEGKYFGDAY